MIPMFDKFASLPSVPFWIDHHAYAGRLLANGQVPWTDIAAYLSWQRSAAALLRPDIITLPVAAFCSAWAAVHPDLPVRMAAKSRLMFALKTLLEDNALRQHLLGLASGLRATFSDKPVILALPSPRNWVGMAYRMAHGAIAVCDVGLDEADSAAVYIADFLGGFGDIGLDGLLLVEAAEAEPASVEDLVYQPVFNVAAHYRWDVGLHLPVAESWQGRVSGPNFVIASLMLDAPCQGLGLGDEFWVDGVIPDAPASGFYHLDIKPESDPEQVLDRLARLRAATGK
ncbi:MAG: hypothetical protein WAT93_01755 [Pontixanthobacter sp.]